MDQYYEGALAIVHGIRDTQVDALSRAMEKAYALKQSGGKMYSHVTYGHYAGWAGAQDIPGQPGVLPQSGAGPKQEEFDAMRRGDFYLTNRVDKNVKAAHERGVFVAGVTNNYFKHYRTPAGALEASKMEFSLEEVSDIVIDSFVPWDNGLVFAPKEPRFKLCPSTGLGQLTVYWACSASLANLSGTKGKGSSREPAELYLDLLRERFLQGGTDRPKIDRIARKWADLVLEKGARLFVYGHPYTVEGYGSGNMFVSDAVSAASGSMIAQAYDPKNTDLRENDILLIGSVGSNIPDEIDVARAGRAKRAYTVAFCPFSADGDSSGVRLFKEADNALNTYADESAGVIAVPGYRFKVCPVTGLTGLLTLWMLTAQWADHMARRGEMPIFWQGVHETGGRAYDAMVRPIFQKRGY
jgi:hypothetical protein